MKWFLICCILSFTIAAARAQGGPIISEFMASNSKTLVDDFGNSEDWIEIANTGATNVNLYNWSLTDNAANLAKWQFPTTNLPAGAHMIVFASNRDRRTTGKPLHTNFKLDATGEYLALVRPDGSIATQFSPTYPPQVTDVSYGFSVDYSSILPVITGSVGRVKIPLDGSLAQSWTSNTFNSTPWTAATNGIGFETGTNEFGTSPVDTLISAPRGYWRLNESVTNGGAVNQGSLGSGANAQYTADMVVNVAGPRPPSLPGFEATNTCARFNGSSSKVEVPYNSSLNPNGPFSLDFWVKPATNNTLMCPLSSVNWGTSRRAGYLVFQTAANQWQFCLGNTTSVTYVAQPTGGTVQSNVWQHIIAVYDGTNAMLYVNGTNVASSTLTGTYVTNATQAFRLGAAGDVVGTNFYNGDIDEVAVYNRALTTAEIATLKYASLIKTDVRTAMSGVNASAYFRLPFVLTTPPAFYQALLRMKYDDGFQAYLNGTPAGSSNAPVGLVWNSTATNRHPTATALAGESFDITSAISSLQTGTNILAIQGLNLSATNSDFLLAAELELMSYGYLDQTRYFVIPTPGTTNSTGPKDLGPIMTQAEFFPQLPGTNDSLTVTCRVTQAFAPVTNVTLYWRVMFGATNATAMLDDGLHGDGAAGDSVYGAVIAKTNYSAGQMVRWYLSAVDSLSHASRWPFFPNPTNYAEYLGTVIQANYVTSAIPIVHLFAPTSVLQPGPTTSQTGADSESGGRVSLYYDGEFYDNIYMELRGNTTAGYNKKSHRVEFNNEHPFRYSDSAQRIRKTSFVADYVDPTYIRQGMSFWLADKVDVPPPFYHPVRLQLNGAFYQLANHSDVQGAEMLERIGYNPAGAYYANVGTAGGSGEKKTRTTDGNTDYSTMINAIAPALSVGQKWTNLLDRFDLPEAISYMVAARFTHQNDDVWMNMALYHDNDGDDLWRIMPYDQNLSWGAAYMDAAVYSGIQVTNDDVKSFPMYGSSQAIPSVGGSWNIMYDLIFQVPQTREMFLRSTRTMLDTYVKPPGTPVGTTLMEQTFLQWRDQIATDAQLDRAWWGWPGKGGQCNFDPGINLTNGVSSLLNDFINNRRNHFYGKHSITNTALAVGNNKTNNAGIPLAQPTNAVVSIVGWDYNPVSGNQDEEYVLLTNANSYAVDISKWKLDGGIQFKFKPGTVIPAGGKLYVSPNTRAFRNRAASPHGGQGLFVVGPYNGHLNAWGESLTLTNDAGGLVSSNSFVGTPSLAQQFLRVTEIMYNPSPATAITNDAQLFEYLELRNTSTNLTLNLTGCRFTNGVNFSFTGSAVTSLTPGQRVLVVRNTTAFAARYGGGALIAGEFAGALDNGGETIRFEDAMGEKILDFDYNNSWYPITDGLGFSLVIVNDLALWSTWGDKASWRPSGTLNGSPGTSDSAISIAPILVNEVLAHTDLPAVDSVELYNPATTNVNLGGWFLTDDFYTPKKYRIPAGTVIPAGGYTVFYADTSFGTGTNAFLFSEYGESAYLFSGDTQTNLTGYYHGWDFNESPNGMSFGRYLDSQTNVQFVLQSTNTLGAANAYPRVGPVVISEIMFHPPDITNGVDNDLDEYIELQNITGTNTPLYCTFTNEASYGLAALTNTWRLRNAVDYDFPTNTTLAAGGRILVVGFNPTNTTQLAAFRALYGVSPGVSVYGPWSGKLDNSADTIELKYPDKPDVTTNVFVPYVMVEKIEYRDTAPWPTNADGLGNSLQRLVATAFGNDPTNWFAVGNTAGQTNLANFLAITSVNGGVSPTFGTAFSVVVQAQNAGGTPTNVVVNTIVTLSRKTGTGTLGGTLTGTILAGNNSVTISGVTYTKAESGVVLTATRTSGDTLAAWNSAAFTVNAGPATTLTLTSGNSQSGVVGTALASPFVVTVTDAGGNPFSGRSVTFAIATVPGGATGQSLSTTSATTAANGQAASTLTLGNLVGTYTVTATSAGLSGSPATFTVSTTGNLAITSVNDDVNPTAGTGFSVVVQAQAGGGAPLIVATDTAVTLSRTTGTGTLGGTLTGTILAGNNSVTISGVNYTKAESGVVLTASRVGGDTLTAGSSAAFTVNAGAAATLTLTSGNSQSGGMATALTSPFVVTVTDASGNPVGGTSVAFAIASAPGSATGQWLSLTSTTTAANGQAATSLTLGDTAGTYTVTATSAGLSGSPATFTATAAPVVFMVDCGTAAPTPGAYDIFQPSFSGDVGNVESMNYYLDNSKPPAQTFITGSNPGGYTLNGVYFTFGPASSFGSGQTSYTLRLYSVSGTSATLISTYTNQNITPAVSSASAGHWFQFGGGITTTLNTNTTYAYSIARIGSGWWHPGVASGSPYLGGEACLIPVAGGIITTGATHNYDATFMVSLAINPPSVLPVITTQPQSQTVLFGTNVTFTVAATGSGPLAYQWCFNGTNIAGAIATNCSIANVQLTNAGNYTVVITNAAGSVTSSVAMLTVVPPDIDGDGMPDVWEVANGLIVGVNDAALDPDHDGLSNLQEFLAHTDPHDAASVLALCATPAGGGQLTLSFTAMADLGYTIQFTAALAPANWQTSQQVAAAPTNRVVTLTNSTAGSGVRFFRIITPAAP